MNGSDSRLPSGLLAMPAPLSLIAVLVVLGIIGQQVQQPGQSRPGAVQGSSEVVGAAQSSGGRSVDDWPRPLRLLCEYLNYTLPELPTDGDSQPAAHGNQEGQSPQARRQKSVEQVLKAIVDQRQPGLHCLIATVPDPIDSHFQLSFDNVVASIARGFEEHECVYDRHSYPWSDDLKGGSGDQGGLTRRSRREPGVILFRGSDGVILLLLVGETPTAGIQKQALSSALDFVAACQQVAPQDASNADKYRDALKKLSVPILGPTYSGSSHSLRLELLRWWTEQRLRQDTFGQLEVNIISGSATADSNETELTYPPPAGPADSAKAAALPVPGLSIRFSATVLPASVCMEALLSRMVRTADRIAILNEANTGFGSGLIKRLSLQAGQITVLPYPVGVSRIRNEYERNYREPSDTDKQRAIEQRRNLDLSLEQPPYATDVLPSFSQATLAVTDVMLEQILTTISRNDIRVVGLFGTDIRDKLFLAEQIRRYAPDTQLYMLESDILYTHARYTPHLKGTLVATSYPLFTRSQGWTGQGERSMQFATDTDQGIYNATVAHLNDFVSIPRPLLDYGFPFSDQQQSRPPLWLTMIGESAFWPIEAIRVSDTPPARKPNEEPQSANAEQQPRPGRQQQPEELAAPPQLYVYKPPSLPPVKGTYRAYPPSSAGLVVVSVASLALSLAILLVNTRRQHGRRLQRWLRRNLPWLPRPEPSDKRQAGIRRGYSFALLSSLLALQFCLISPTALFLMLDFFPGLKDLAHSLWSPGVAFAATLSLVSILATGAALYVTFHSLAKVAWLGGVGVLLAVLVGLWPIPFVFGLLQTDIPVADRLSTIAANTAVFVERAGGYSSGVTPIVPLAIIVFLICLWAVCHLRRLHFTEVYALSDAFNADVDEHVLAASTSHATCPHLAGIGARLRDLNRRITSPRVWPSELLDWAFLLWLATTVVYVFVYRWIGTAEGPVYDWLFFTVVCLSLICLAELLIRLKSVCGLFERYLRRMGRHAMVSAFRKVPQVLLSKAAGQIFAAAPHPADLEQPVLCLVQLATIPVPGEQGVVREAWPGSVADADEVLARFSELLNVPRSDQYTGRVAAANLNRRLNEIGHQHLVPMLLDYWNQKAIDRNAQDKEQQDKEQQDKEKQDKEAQASAESKWRQQAEMFLAIQQVYLIRQVFAHIQNMLTMLIAMLIGLMICFDSYPFQPHRLLMTICYALVFYATFLIIVGLVKFNRNEVLSLINNTTPSRFTMDRTVVLPLLTYVAIPLVSLLAVQFPMIGHTLFGWFDVLQQMFRA